MVLLFIDDRRIVLGWAELCVIVICVRVWVQGYTAALRDCVRFVSRVCGVTVVNTLFHVAVLLLSRDETELRASRWRYPC